MTKPVLPCPYKRPAHNSAECPYCLHLLRETNIAPYLSIDAQGHLLDPSGKPYAHHGAPWQ